MYPTEIPSDRDGRDADGEKNLTPRGQRNRDKNNYLTKNKMNTTGCSVLLFIFYSNINYVLPQFRNCLLTRLPVSVVRQHVVDQKMSKRSRFFRVYSYGIYIFP